MEMGDREALRQQADISYALVLWVLLFFFFFPFALSSLFFLGKG